MDPEITAYVQVAVISVLLAGALAAIVVGLVRGVQSKPKQLRVADAHGALSRRH